MAFQHPPLVTSIKRAALYLRVSTGRQAAGKVSLASQRDLTRRFCEAQGWTVVEEFVEPGASATDGPSSSGCWKKLRLQAVDWTSSACMMFYALTVLGQF
jgi:hypothetical protein